MTSFDLRNRFLDWVANVIEFLRTLRKEEEFNVIKYQLAKSSSSSGANYSAACRSKSGKDFLYKLKIVEEELDESLFWLELCFKIGVEKKEIESIKSEASELIAIVAASINTTRQKLNADKK